MTSQSASTAFQINDIDIAKLMHGVADQVGLLSAPHGDGSCPAINIDPDKVGHDLAKLVLTLIEFLHRTSSDPPHGSRQHDR